MGKLTTSDIIKKQLVEAMKSSLGVITIACANVGCSRDTFYRYLKEDASFKLQVEDVGEIALDFAESQLHKKIAGVKMTLDNGETVFTKEPDTTAIIFYLKTKGRNRGYIERQEVITFEEQPLFPYNGNDIIDVTED